MATAEFVGSKRFPVGKNAGAVDRHRTGRRVGSDRSSAGFLERLFGVARRPVQPTSISERAIEGFLREETLWGSPDRPLCRDTALLDAGILEPVNLECLVRFLEDQFEINIGDDQLVSGNFACIASIAAMVDAIRATTPARSEQVDHTLGPALAPATS